VLKRIKRITSHAGCARYLASVRAWNVATIPRQTDIPRPYCYSPDWNVHRAEDGRFVTVIETAHRRYDVFEVPAAMIGR
jgi:hypothetical protein